MATIGLGQNVFGSFTNSDPVLNGAYYDEYDLLNLDSFRQLTITFDPAGTQAATNTPGTTTIDLINSATGGLIARNTAYGSNGYSYSGSIDETTFPGINYKVRVSNSSLSTLGNYKLSLIDEGKAKSIISTSSYSTRGSNGPQVGTIGTSGKFFTLASGGDGLDDVAMATNGQIYGISSSAGTYLADQLSIVNPNLNQGSQVDFGTDIKNTAGTNLYRSLRSLGFDNNGQLYSIGTTPTGTGEFYRIDPTTKVATLLATLPAGLSNSGDLVYDPTNQRFLATAPDTGITDALWQIPLANPASATKIGQIGSLFVHGLNFENGQLTGFTNPGSNPKRISINPITGAGTLNQSVSGTTYAYGSATIVQNIRNDFNNDSKSDILWRKDDGTVALWQMNGSTVTTGSYVTPTLDSTWKIASTADFNGDGKADLLWRNDNGTNALWTMNGSTIVGGGYVTTLDSTWKVASTADFSGDGKADLLWRKDDGTTALWTMNGAAVVAGGYLPTLDSTWKVASSGDFDGDAKADLLWRNDDGTTALWKMNGATVVSGSYVTPTLDSTWKVASSADFDGDGKTDLLWRKNDGTTALWTMNGAAVVAGGYLPTLDNTWKVASSGDFNGDGKADILWRNDNGINALWEMNGATVLAGSYTPTLDSSWQVAAPIL
jgi:FG-GAP-like repeat